MQNNSVPQSTVGVVDGENIIVRQSWLNQFPLVLVALALEVIIVYISLEFPDVAAFSFKIGSATISASYLPLLPLLVIARAALYIYNERLVITPNYLIHVTGRISWSERSSRLEYSHIQEIETVETIAQRILGLGDLNILPIGAGNRQEILMKGLRHPRAVKDVIRSLKDTEAAV